MRTLHTILLFILCFTVTVSQVSAHGSSFSYEENKDGYLIDIGYDEFIAEGESVRFDFIVYPEDITAIEGEVFTDVWVTITQDNKIFFAGGIEKPVFGATGFTYVFPKEGEYTLSARFQNEGDSVVETEFPLTIIPPLEGEETTLPPLVIGGVMGVAGLAFGIGIGLFIPRNKALKENQNN